MSKLLTENVREILQVQYQNEDLVEIDGCIYHVPHEKEAWKSLRDEVRPGWEVMLEEEGLKHYVIYNPEWYKALRTADTRLLYYYKITEDIELPINCSSCSMMFLNGRFPDGFKFQKSFDTSEIVDMIGMFSGATFSGDMSLGDNFKTDKVENFRGMFSGTKIKGNLDLGSHFSLENTKCVESMFSQSNIGKPIKFGDKFNPENALKLSFMFDGIRQLPEGFNIGNNFHIRDGASVAHMFNDTELNDNFWLPDCFNVSENNKGYSNIFGRARLPKRVANIESKNVKEIIAGLKVRDSEVAIDHLSSI